VATLMAARTYIGKVMWWIGEAAVYVALYLGRGLYFTAALYASYLALAWVGYRSWRKALPA